MKKVLSLVLAVMLILTALPMGTFTFTASAEDVTEYTDGYYTYTVANGEVTITNVNKFSIGGDIIIPPSFDGYPVTCIGDFAFQGCNIIMSIVIPDTVKSIGYYAFGDCNRLTEITIPDKVTSIGDYAFASCDSLETANISSDVTSIGVNAFRYCGALKNINVSQANTKYLSSDGVLFNKEKTDLIRYPAGKSETYYSVPDGVTTIAACAFEDSMNLTNVTVVDSVTSIGLYAFNDCDSLEKLTIPFVGETVDGTSNTHFGYIFGAEKNYTYNDQYVPQSLKEVVITNAIKIGSHAFDYCDYITSITLPNTLESIGYQAFYDCDGITEMTIPDSVINIGNEAFRGCNKLVNVNVSSDNEVYSSLDGVVFDKNKATLVCYPTGKDGATYNIPDSVITIGSDAFSNSNLTSVFMPNGVLQIDDFAFYNCSALDDIWYFGTEADKDNIEIGNNAFPSVVWHYNTCPNEHTYNYECSEKCVNCDWVRETEPHKYDNECDAICNICSEEREVQGHIYDDNCDIDCNTCYTERIAPHTYDNDCDIDCNDCGDVREISHIYDNACDAYCNVCYTSRDVPEHIFDNNCDATCNECGTTRFVPNHVYSNSCDTTCNECGEMREIAHNYQTQITKPTCTEQGYTTHTCSVCGDSYVDNYVDEPGHIYDHIYDANCNECGAIREASPLEWEISVEKTGVYSLKPNSKYTGSFSIDKIAVYDKNGNEVRYNESKQGFPLVKDQKYTVKFRYDCSDEITGTVTWTKTKKSDAIFSDASASEWYNDAITYSVGRGLISGYGGTTKFGPGDNIQRQDFLVILARLDGVDLTEYGNQKSSFPDVPEGSYYEAAINWGAKNGIVTGYQNGKFGVGDKITREQLVTFLYRYADYKGVDVSYTDSTKNTVSKTYTDYKKVSGWSQDCVLWAIEKGVIKGKTSTTIVPGGNALRCEVAQIMYNIFLKDIF